MLAVGICAGVLAGACTLTAHGYDDCTTTADCRTAFGLGWTCGGDGLCAHPPPRERCTTTYPDDLLVRPESYTDAYVIGCIADESLDTQVFRERSVGLALSQVNESGALDMHRFGVVCCNNAQDSSIDGLDTVGAAVDDANWLVDVMGVSAIVGPSRSDEVEAVFGEVGPRGVLVISPSATSPALTALEPDASDSMPGLLWRTAPPDTIQGRVIAMDMLSRGIASVGVIAEAGPYGEGLAAVVEREFDGPARAATVMIFASSTERDSIVTDVARGAFDEVLFLSSQTSDAVAFLRAASVQAGYDTKTFFLSDGAANQDLLIGAADASVLFPRVRLTRPAAPSGVVYDAFASAYVAKYGVDEVANRSFTAHAFDAAWMVFYGHGWAAEQELPISGHDVALGLRHLSTGDAFDVRPGDWDRILSNFRRGDPVDLTGASGPLDYDATTEETTGPIELLTISPSGTTFE